ncbi:MAG TPA: glycosyltransferase family 39 protein [Bacteroidota bacterium]|nr:glycosyltransferase family 39 protein [Bacteroidota bacterium]
MTEKNSFRENIALLLVLLIAAIVRLVHINWGLPEIYEEATPSVIAWKMWHWGQPGLDFNPHFFNYPALTFYVNLIFQYGLYLFGHVAGWFPNLEAYRQANSADPAAWIMGARCISVLFDMGTITVLYVLARGYLSRPASLLTALFAALNPLLIRNSQSVNVDTPMTFFAAASLYCIGNVYRTGEWKWYVRAGISIALAASSKYNGAFLLPVLLAAHLFRSESIARAMRSIFDIRLISSAGVALALFFALNPFILLSFREFYQDFSFEESHMLAGHLGIDPNQGTLSYYFMNVLPGALGLIMMAALVLSVVVILLKFRKDQILLLIFPVLYLAVIQSWTMRAERYALPAIPVLILVSILGISTLWQELTQRFGVMRSGALRIALPIILIVLMLFQPVAADIRYHASLSLPDTRAVAKEWILQHVPAGAVIAEQPIGMALPDSLYRVFPIPYLAVNIERMSQFYDTRWYEDLDVVVGSDFDYQRYRKDPARYKHFLTYYDSLRARFNVIYEANPAGLQPGPGVWLYQPRPEIQRDRFDKDLFEQLTAVPESVWVNRFLHNLAYMLISKSKFGKAEQIFREILSVEPNDMNARRSLVGVLLDQDKTGPALQEAQSALQSSPEDAVCLGLEGKIYAKVGRTGEAERSMLKAITINPKLEFPYDDLLIMYRDQRDKKKALDILNRHLRILDPQSQKAKLVAADIQTLQRLPEKP